MNDQFSSMVLFLFWLLFLVSLLQPVLAARRLQAARLALIRKVEERYGWRVVTMIHREEKVAFFGIPIHRYINIEDSEAVLR
ncbi:MAG: hypothetical protein F7B78_01770, partial [Desulfurococcales archaeon]|nr:hypothetical protein [Desulfurococcales archaeon]